MRNKKIFITGMHCVSCEKLLNYEFREIKGVKDVKVNRKKNWAEIYYADYEPKFDDLKTAARKYGYDAFENETELKAAGKKKINWSEYISAIFIVVAILFFYKILEDSGIIGGLNVKSSQINYVVAFLIGLVASISSCLAVVGSVVIAFAEKYQTKGKTFYQSSVRPNLYFHIGRLGTFFVLGGILGLVGGEINISGNFISIYTILIALIMAWLGLNILGLLPSLSAAGIKMPGKLTAKWDALKQSENAAAPFILGGLSFFLPCGFTQSMQIFALTSGSFLTGAFSLFLFALATVPSLMIVGITASWTRSRGMSVLQKVGGILILIFAIFTLNSGLALKGVAGNVLTTNKTEEKQQPAPAPSEAQTLKMSVMASSFEPSVLKIKKGIPVKWVINGDRISGCTSRIIVPSLNISRALSAGENVITFTPSQSGEIPFSCGMGMVRGKFVVE